MPAHARVATQHDQPRREAATRNCRDGDVGQAADQSGPRRHAHKVTNATGAHFPASRQASLLKHLPANTRTPPPECCCRHHVCVACFLSFTLLVCTRGAHGPNAMHLPAKVGSHRHAPHSRFEARRGDRAVPRAAPTAAGSCTTRTSRCVVVRTSAAGCSGSAQQAPREAAAGSCRLTLFGGKKAAFGNSCANTAGRRQQGQDRASRPARQRSASRQAPFAFKCCCCFWKARRGRKEQPLLVVFRRDDDDAGPVPTWLFASTRATLDGDRCCFQATAAGLDRRRALRLARAARVSERGLVLWRNEQAKRRQAEQ